MGDSIYTRKFGGRRVTQGDVLYLRPGKPGVTIVDDLQTGHNLPSAAFDCVILTQTLQYIPDARAAVATLHRILKPGGVVLATLPGISPLVSDEKDGWFDHWRWTAAGAHHLWAERFGAAGVRVVPYGNLAVAVAILAGRTLSEVPEAHLDHRDPDYDVLIALHARKGGDTAVASRAVPAARRTARRFALALGEIAPAAFSATVDIALAWPRGGNVAIAGRFGTDDWGYPNGIALRAAASGASRALAPEIAARTAIHAPGHYYTTGARLTGSAAGPGRGDGLPIWVAGAAAALAHETAIDALARARRLDPLDYRETIALKRGMPTVSDQWLSTAAALPQCLAAVRPRWAAVAGRAKAGSGAAVAAGWHGLGPTYGTAPATVRLRRRGAGRLEIDAPVPDAAVGKLLRAVAARRLGMPLARVTLAAGRPPASLAAATWRQGFALGRAVDLAASGLGAGRVARAAVDSQTWGPDAKGLGVPYHLYGFAAAVAEVAAGARGVRVRRVTVAANVGRAVDAAAARARATAGARDAIALVLGRAAAKGAVIDVILVEDPEPTGAFGAIGLGEPAAIAVVPALALAIGAATGRAVTRLPYAPAPTPRS